MITIYADDKKIYDPRVEKLQLEEAQLQQTKNKAGSVTFTIPATHAYAQTSIIPGITRIVVKEDEETVFRGRITKNNPNFWDDAECTAEGDLAYLNDTIVRPYEFSGSPREYFTFLITQHNAQVEKERQFTVGRVTIKDPNDYIVRSSVQYPSTWEELESKLLDSMGGFLVERWEDGVTYLDYLEDVRENNDQIAKYGENIVDIDRIKEIDSGFATAVIPLGKKQEAEKGKEAKYLTIESVNNEKDYVQDDDAVSKYGLILKTVEHEDVTLPENLLRKGKEDVAEAIKSVESITVTAADLSGTGVNIESFRFMKNVRCVSKRHNLNFRSPIVSLTRNLLDRSDYKITVGNTQKSYTGASVTTRREDESKIEEIVNLERDARKRAIEDLVSKVEKAPGLYITDTGEGDTHNWYLHDKETVEESYIIIRVNAAGIIFSTDGGNHYNGVSWDGDAILKKIYTIGLDATHIETGTLNADLVKVINLHLQDISDSAGTTLDATLDGITSTVSKKVGDNEIISKINQSAEKVSITADKIEFTGSTKFSSAIKADKTISGLSDSVSEAIKSISQITQTVDGITTEVSKKVGNNEIISKINQSAEAVNISASKINLKGAVTLTSLDSKLKSTLSDAQAASDTVDDWSYNKDRTEIDGGKVAANTITAEKIAIGDFLNYATVTENDASTLLSDQAIVSSTTHGDWIEKSDETTGLQYLFVSQLYCINSFAAKDILKFDFNVWCSTAQKVTYGIWFYDGEKTYKTGAWNTVDIPAGGSFTNVSGKIEIPSLPVNIKYYHIGFEFEKYNSDSRNCIQKAKVNKISGYFQIGEEGFIDSFGAFQLGPMHSVGDLNDDIEFKHAIFVDYGIELLSGNDGATPYIDFHTDGTTHDNTVYDYTARIQNTKESWISFYGLREGQNDPAACTVQAGQFQGTFVDLSDKRLKKEINDLNIAEVLDDLMRYRPVSYQYINGVDTNVHHGLIAQEAQEIADWGLVDDRGQYLAIHYTELIADLIKAQQYTLTEVKRLKEVIEKLQKERSTT